jgi:nitroreductase
MDLNEAIRFRKSIRAYKSDPVPKKILAELLETCLRAPSWGNTQPWEFAVVGGKVMDELKRALVQKAEEDMPENPDIPAPAFADRYLERRKENGRQLFEVLGIAREDREKRRQWYLTGINFFGAPNAIIIYIDKSLGAWSILDTGIVMQTIMLAAPSYGLGTCALYRGIVYPDELRRILKIPESKLIVCALTIGYPDMDAPQNRFWSTRDPLNEFVTWHGIEEDNT